MLGVISVTARWHGLTHTLGYDEAWVANSLLAPTIRQMLFYDTWAQTTPPGFLLVARGVVEAVGTSNLSFHLLPFVLGLLGVAVITWIGWREFSPERGLWMGLLAALSGPQVAFSKETKQYGGEFLAAALLLAFLLRIPPRLLRWGPPAALGGAFAFGPGMLAFLPAAIIAKRPSWRIAAIWIVGTMAIASILVMVFYGPNRSPDLFQYWRPCFVDWNDLASFTKVIWIDLRTIVAAGFGETLPAQRALRWAAMLIAAIGILRGWRTPHAALALVPIAVAIAANLAGQYPLCQPRLTSFLFPGVLLLHGLAWQWTTPRWLLQLALTAALAGGIWLSFQSAYWPPRQLGGVQQGVTFLKSHMDPAADVLFIHGIAQEEYKLYSRLANFAPTDVVVGQTGVGCCPRPMDWHRAYNDDAYLVSEFEQLLARGTARRIWFLHIRQGSMNEPRQEEPVHRAMLAKKMCQREQDFVFQNTLISAYRCPL